MKRRDLIRHIEKPGCELLREGARHSVYVSRQARKSSTIPRHREINDDLARKICRRCRRGASTTSTCCGNTALPQWPT